MLTYLKELLWDKVEARAAFFFVATLAVAYYNQPHNRPWEERLAGAAVQGGLLAGAASSFRPKGD